MFAHDLVMTRYIVPKGVIGCPLFGKLIILRAKGPNFYVLNQTAGRLWLAIVNGRSLYDECDSIANECTVPLAVLLEDTASFLTSAMLQELLVSRPSSIR